jgi:hypothetical protein
MISLTPFRALFTVGVAIWLCMACARPIRANQPSQRAAQRDSVPVFQTADACLACHNGLSTTSGEDVSIGSDWRGSMMANAAHDPYWQASVRRETIDHPDAAADIEDRCAACHLPMARARAASMNRKGQVFAHLSPRLRMRSESRLAQDGVSCTICHQISGRNLETADSFNGGFAIERESILGPFTVDAGRAMVMQSATDYRPVEATHVRKSELCATCHTQFTRALGPHGEIIGALPEQTPFLEWRRSAFRDQQSCQSCHMPVVQESIPIASVLGTPREGLARHVFRGGNFFVLGMLNRFRADLGVQAISSELQMALRHTINQLQTDTAAVSVAQTDRAGNRLDIEVVITNLTGHKLPTGFPSRRAWIHLAVRDAAGRAIFESGAISADGRIAGNDNDEDPQRFEPHYATIRRGDEVQIYESIVGDVNGNVTTGLLSGVRYVKDNRLLPEGFDKGTAEPDIAVIGDAARDADFSGGRDRVHYTVDLPDATSPITIEVELRFQPVGFRWARNLADYTSAETRQFGRYYDVMSSTSSIVLAHAATSVK